MVLIDYPPLSALARVITSPPVSLAPFAADSPAHVAASLELRFRVLQEDFRHLPLVACDIVHLAALAYNFSSSSFLPYLPPQDAQRHFLGLMRTRVLDNAPRDPSYSALTADQHLSAASRHLTRLIPRLAEPCVSPAGLLQRGRDLSDLAVYTTFAFHVSVPVLLKHSGGDPA